MADLLSSLEIGMTRTVGAASRIRTQISIIEEYMDAQRQPDFAGLSASNSAYSKQVPLPAATNPNIDPSLQNTAGAADLYQQTRNDVDFKGELASGIDGTNVSISQSPSDQFQFQLPPELLEGWPWPFDMSHGIGSF